MRDFLRGSIETLVVIGAVFVFFAVAVSLSPTLQAKAYAFGLWYERFIYDRELTIIRIVILAVCLLAFVCYKRRAIKINIAVWSYRFTIRATERLTNVMADHSRRP